MHVLLKKYKIISKDLQIMVKAVKKINELKQYKLIIAQEIKI